MTVQSLTDAAARAVVLGVQRGIRLALATRLLGRIYNAAARRDPDELACVVSPTEPRARKVLVSMLATGKRPPRRTVCWADSAECLAFFFCEAYGYDFDAFEIGEADEAALVLLATYDGAPAEEPARAA